jgi:molecular chaperone Hsp33
MSELHKFIFDGLPVRGAIVRLTDTWQEVLHRRDANTKTGAFPAPVNELLGEMLAAGALMQSNIKFNGALILQIMGDGPLKIAVAEVQSDLSMRATATVQGEIADASKLSDMVNVLGQGRCAITLDPKDPQPGQQAYQGVVPLHGDRREKLEKMSEVLEHYMLQSEQLDTRLVLAANDKVAAGLLIQRMPVEGEGNLEKDAARIGWRAAGPSLGSTTPSGGSERHEVPSVGAGDDESFNRIATFASSLKREELLTLDVDAILHRLYWDDPHTRFEPAQPRFACTCSHERVAAMLRNLGTEEVESVIAEQGSVEVGCEFCGAQYRFDPVQAAEVFIDAQDHPPGSARMQ